MDQTTTVRELAAAEPASLRVFEQFGIDYCCGGQKPLAQACAERAVDVNIVLAALAAAREKPAAGKQNWTTAPLQALCRHIEQTHHVFVREEIERLQALAAKVEARHGAAHPELAEIGCRLAALREELLPHQRREELVLFPGIVQQARPVFAGGFAPTLPLVAPPRPLWDRSSGATGQHCLPATKWDLIGTPFLDLDLASTESTRSLPRLERSGVSRGLRGAIAAMLAEHDGAGAEMEAIRQLSGGFAPPEGACATYRAFYSGLAEFERDLRQHLHLENNILFPRALAREDA